MKGRIAAIGLAAGLSLVASFEGLRNYAYADPVGIPTVCYGHTKDVRLGQFVPTAQCQALLEEEYWQAVMAVHRCSPYPLAPHELGAFASAVYNIGPRLVCDTQNSTLARHLKAGDITAACNQLPRWNKAKGIVLPGLDRRRVAEQKMCLGRSA